MLLLTVADICERLQCGPAKVYRLVKDGHLRARKSPGRTGALRFTEEDLEAYLEACLTSVPSAVRASWASLMASSVAVNE